MHVLGGRISYLLAHITKYKETCLNEKEIQGSGRLLKMYILATNSHLRDIGF